MTSQIGNQPPIVKLKDRGLLESPRWHDGSLWFADWTSGEILTLREGGDLRIAAKAAAPPLSFDFTPNGTLMVVAAGSRHLLYQRPDGSLQPFVEFGAPGAWNEIVIDATGRIYVNGPQLLLIRPDGSMEVQAEGFQFPNGMAIAEDGNTLVCAESHGRRLTAFTVDADGRLSNRRIWAELPGPPDGICFDIGGSIWYADVPNACCRRVNEGGQLLEEIKLDRGCFACMTGGPARRTLFITAAKWFGMERLAEIAGTGQVTSVEIDVPGAGWPYN